MKTVELFCGTKSFSKYAKSIGHETYTADIDYRFNPHIVCDLLKPLHQDLHEKIIAADMVWMSPVCKTLSMASGNTHWTADRKPKTKEAIDGKNMISFCKWIAKYCEKQGKIYFIENPRARARWFLPEHTRKTVWYCQYGDDRAKPTDIWTNLKGWNGKQCSNGNKQCHHAAAPRGSRTGTQGLKGVKQRGEIPQELFKELFSFMKEDNQE